MIFDKYNQPIKPAAGPVRDNEILKTYESFPMKSVLDGERHPDLISSFKNIYVEWIHGSQLNKIHWPNGLDTFVTQAITQSIESFLFLHRKKRFRILPGEYLAVQTLMERFRLNWEWIKDPDHPKFEPNDAFLISAPFSALGDAHPQMDGLLKKANDKNVSTFVDCAFWGICHGVELNLNYDCIETIAFSPSKAFRLGGLRIGIEFSKNVSPTIALVNERGYVNRHGAAIAYGLFQEFGADYLPKKYLDLQKEICHELDLTPSKTIIFGLGDDQKYQEWDRGGGFRRLCLNEALAYRWEQRVSSNESSVST